MAYSTFVEAGIVIASVRIIFAEKTFNITWINAAGGC